MIERYPYFDQIKPFIDKPVIKIITGIRRSGKSTILKLLKDYLLNSGIEDEQIVLINFESFTSNYLHGAAELYDFVKGKAIINKKLFLLLDEIQEVTGWEKAINSFFVDFDVDIYLTGSNSHLLSSELATFLAGRYIEIPVFTLSYQEFISFRKRYFPTDTYQIAFTDYMRMGGFPALSTVNYDLESAYKIVDDIYSSVILRDTIQRFKIRDVELLERVIRYAFDNIGNTFSGKNIADYFKSQQRKMDINTIYNYLFALEGAFIVYRVPRYDIKGKEILKTQEKFYLGDVALLYARMGFRDHLISGILENLVFLELKRRGYRVFIGKVDAKEIDFIAERKEAKIYIQVAYKLDSERTVEREFAPLLAVKDHHPKFVVTMDDFWRGSLDGIRHFHIADFLLSKEY